MSDIDQETGLNSSWEMKDYKKSMIQNLEIPLPPLPEQEKIVAQLDAIAERTQALEAATTAQIKKLSRLKASLLDAAFRGKLGTN